MEPEAVWLLPHDWGVTTQKGNKLYVHILNLQDKALFLPIVDKKVKKAVVFADKTPVRFTKNKEGIVLELVKVPTGCRLRGRTYN